MRRMLLHSSLLLASVMSGAGALDSLPAAERPFRPPSVPLVSCDPYFSIWSSADQLTGSDTVHWTGKPHRLTALLRVDGKAYRLMGSDPPDVPALPQTSVKVLPTRTVYDFSGAGLTCRLTFCTPALPDQLDVLARPVTYVDFALKSLDSSRHDVSLYVDASGELAVNKPDDEVAARHDDFDALQVLRIGSIDQQVLAKNGDDLRIDWGYFYMASTGGSRDALTIGRPNDVRTQFVQNGTVVRDPREKQVTTAGGDVVVALSMACGEVGSSETKRWLMLAYDDLFSIRYMQQDLRPYWRRNGATAHNLLELAAAEHSALLEQCEKFDGELMADLTRVGGEQYAQIAALAYRQCFAAGKFVADAHGQPMQFCKENHSNGCIGTSDVFYPMAPQFLLFGPTLAKSFLVPFMNYAASDRWRFPFAPHDLGRYPHANGQRYGGGEHSDRNQMPVEESGNLLLLMAAIAHMEGNAGFASLYWPQLSTWAEFLKDKGFDPENQLCTDDFAGHLAHNVNLSAKAICALGAFSRLCQMRGDQALAREYQRAAQEYARRWVVEARDGDHYRLAFDKPGTWSQKYNLVWDRILQLDLFPNDVKEAEVKYYRQVQGPFGLPLDHRSTYTKLDWVLWSATLTQNRDDFRALVDPVYQFLNRTPDRVPMTDWYFTDTGKRRGFTARPVVGGVFLQMLYQQEVWSKYANRERTKAAGWAPMPVPPRSVVLVATSREQPAAWRFSTRRPPRNWMKADFDDRQWNQGPGGFGTIQTPGAVVGTHWDSSDIWIRRKFSLNGPLPKRAALRLHHDEDAEVFINGRQVVRARGYTTDYELKSIDSTVLQSGQNTIAIHCRQTTGGQFIDAGIVALIPVEE